MKDYNKMLEIENEQRNKMIKKRINQNREKTHEISSAIEKEILLNLLDINNYSESALYCLKNNDLTHIDKDEVIAYFSTVPELCKEIETLIYDLESAIKLESDNNNERL